MRRSRRYHDRRHAGRVLAEHVAARIAGADLALGLPRGGVPVAAEVAARLGAALDVLVVRKIGVPGHEELAMGAVASGGLRVLNAEVIDHLGIDDASVERGTARAQRELDRRTVILRGDRPAPTIAERTVVVVDDGLATGATMRAALATVRATRPALLVAAVPVGAPGSCRELEHLADVVVCPLQPMSFGAVGWWYEDFSPTTDDDVVHLLSGHDR